MNKVIEEDVDTGFSVRILLAGSSSAILYFFIARFGDVRPDFYAFITLISAAAVLYIMCAKSLFSSNGNRKATLPQLWLILAFALLFRLLLLPGYPNLTDDIYRYMWDGHVWFSGVNPYQFAPGDPALAPIRDQVIFPNVSFPEIPTIYAPILQLVFRATYTISPTIVGFKSAMLVFDLASIAVVLLLLKQKNSNLNRVLLYAWNPLILIEISGSGHVDIVGVALLLASFLFLMEGKKAWADMFLGLSILTKFIPLILLPFFIIREPRIMAMKRAVRIAAVVLLGYAFFWQAGENLAKAMFIYAQKWRFNDSLYFGFYHLLNFLTPDAVVQGYIESKKLTANPETMASFRIDMMLLNAKVLMATLFAVIYGTLLVWYKKLHVVAAERTLPLIWFTLFGALSLLSTTLHPWYLIWLIPFFIFYVDYSWLVLSGTILWSYEIVHRFQGGGVWVEAPWVKALVLVPFFILLSAELFRKKQIIQEVFCQLVLFIKMMKLSLWQRGKEL